MLLTISTTHTPATDLGYLLHKNPARLQQFDLAFGKANVFYPVAGEDQCTCALLVDVDPVGLVRNRRGPAGEGFALDQYVNDRPYAASSFLAVAIAQVFGSALAGTSRERAELAATPIALRVHLPVVPSRGGEGVLRSLFEPLGYLIEFSSLPLDETFPEWGGSRYFDVTLTHTLRLSDLLSHLYVLLPVLDDDKHYWVGDDEVDKLLRHGEGWLKNHPGRELIVRRYLKHRKSLERAALERLLADEVAVVDESLEQNDAEEDKVEQKISLNQQRLDAVTREIVSCGARRVLDLGCSSGNLLRRLLDERSIDEIVGYDVSYRSLEVAMDRLHYDRLPERQKARLKFIHGSLTYRDKRIAGYDAAAVVEVIEHLDPQRLSSFERVLFEFARPSTIVLTTPNVEYNVRWETLPAGQFRHRDHRFEWTRAQFQQWAEGVAKRFGYAVRFEPVGEVDPAVGPPTQMAVFARGDVHGG
jgi:3' terminal RNA ribose 2'-O-methyltransferase Hen1